MYQNFIIPYLYEAQHVSGDTTPIIRSLKLHWQPLVFHTWKVFGCVVGGHYQACTWHTCRALFRRYQLISRNGGNVYWKSAPTYLFIWHQVTRLQRSAYESQRMGRDREGVENITWVLCELTWREDSVSPLNGWMRRRKALRTSHQHLFCSTSIGLNVLFVSVLLVFQ
jgi:hypothetical protein